MPYKTLHWRKERGRMRKKEKT